MWANFLKRKINCILIMTSFQIAKSVDRIQDTELRQCPGDTSFCKMLVFVRHLMSTYLSKQ